MYGKVGDIILALLLATPLCIAFVAYINEAVKAHTHILR